MFPMFKRWLWRFAYEWVCVPVKRQPTDINGSYHSCTQKGSEFDVIEAISLGDMFVVRVRENTSMTSCDACCQLSRSNSSKNVQIQLPTIDRHLGWEFKLTRHPHDNWFARIGGHFITVTGSLDYRGRLIETHSRSYGPSSASCTSSMIFPGIKSQIWRYNSWDEWESRK